MHGHFISEQSRYVCTGRTPGIQNPLELAGRFNAATLSKTVLIVEFAGRYVEQMLTYPRALRGRMISQMITEASPNGSDSACLIGT